MKSFTALKDINFTVKKGEWLGVIGHNGSGKSTLLKIIANTVRPTKGKITVNGKITSFLELGVGFQPRFDRKRKYKNLWSDNGTLGQRDRGPNR